MLLDVRVVSHVSMPACSSALLSSQVFARQGDILSSTGLHLSSAQEAAAIVLLSPPLADRHTADAQVRDG